MAKGWVVTVTTESESGGAPLVQVFETSIANPKAAAKAVDSYIGPSPRERETIEVTEELSESDVAALGLGDNEVRGPRE